MPAHMIGSAHSAVSEPERNSASSPRMRPAKNRPDPSRDAAVPTHVSVDPAVTAGLYARATTCKPVSLDRVEVSQSMADDFSQTRLPSLRRCAGSDASALAGPPRSLARRGAAVGTPAGLCGTRYHSCVEQPTRPTIPAVTCHKSATRMRRAYHSQSRKRGAQWTHQASGCQANRRLRCRQRATDFAAILCAILEPDCPVGATAGCSQGQP